MSIKKLFENNRQNSLVSKYLKKTSPEDVGGGIESAAHLSASIKKNNTFLPPVDYGDLNNFVKFGSAEKYYEKVFEYIVGYYPYDGTGFEKTNFYNELNPLEKHILEFQYPSSTGFVNIGSQYGSAVADAGGSGFYNPDDKEYIKFKGGPHSGTVYSEPSNRTSNLEFGGISGSTVEFFFRKNEGMPNASAQGTKQSILDVWNGSLSGSSDYGRLRIQINSGSEDRFYVTMMSGTKGFFEQSIPTTGNLNLTDGAWHQYAFVFNTSGSAPTVDFYKDGICIETQIAQADADLTGEISLVTGSLVGNIGALRTSPSGNAYHGVSMEGYGKLSASLDEFRFWKESRTSEDVGRFWFTHVNGGTNNYDDNKSLGVYFKFNEGITETTSVDEIVLDYSGRLSNGIFTGYNSSYSRNTGSAIDSMSLTSVSESKDPIVRDGNPLYVSEKQYFSQLGEEYDRDNPARLINSIPSWITEEDENLSGELSSIVQIISNYFDTLRLQIEGLSKVKNQDYSESSLSGSTSLNPYADRLVENLGMEAPEIFENISAMGQFLERDEQINFNQSLVKTKSLIYKNIYNNLSSIYKAKGTEKSVQNFIRCFGVGENILSINSYPNNTEYFVTSSYKGLSSPKKYVDFTGLTSTSNNEATVYQYYDSTNTNSVGLLTGSQSSLSEFAFTLEGEFIFPNKDNIDNLGITPRFPISSSLFGYHTPEDVSLTSTDLTWTGSNGDWGYQIYAIKSPGAFAKVRSPLERVRDVYFAVLNRHGETLLTSSIFTDAYNNEKWNLALSLRPSKYPFVGGVEGATTDEYTLELCGFNYKGGEILNNFSISSSVTSLTGTSALNSAKRVYAGAHRTNFNGVVETMSDVRASSVRFWNDYLTPEVINYHAKESFSYGTVNAYQNAYSFQQQNPNVFIPKVETLALNWDFANLSGSDSSGQFIVDDFSSGSNDPNYISNYQEGLFSPITLRQHTGRGDFFDSDTNVVKKEYIFTQKLQIPDYAMSSDMVKVLGADDEYFNINQRPSKMLFAVEKSLYKNISERMLQLFSSIEEYNNMIGEPVNKYRHEYKNLKKFKEIFFRKVENTPDFEKYTKFYKWLDVSMSEMIEQLFPASAGVADSVRTLIESHVLERPKIKYGYPGAYKTSIPKPAGTVSNLGSICPDEPGWKYNHAPVGGTNTSENCFWWRTRASRLNSPLNAVTNESSISGSREAILNAVKSDLTSSQLVCLSGDLNLPKVGGINQFINKKRRVTDVVLSDFSAGGECSDELKPNQKVLATYTATKDGVSYKGQLLSPFTVLSSSFGGTFLDNEIADIAFTNINEDSIHNFDSSVPIQGPFTDTHVGGIQARHVNPLWLYSTDRTLNTNRKESRFTTIANNKVYIDSILTGSGVRGIPKGQYLRGLGSKSPLNIQNIRTVTGSMDGVHPIGNFKINYEVVQGGGRETNIDMAASSASFLYAEPTAFLTPPPDANDFKAVFGENARPLSGSAVGSADYPAPRQRAGRKITKSIFASRFAAPGSTVDSKQQFRDVPTDQKSPNNALPFRNIPVRQVYNTQLRNYTGWGGFVTSSGVNALEHYGPGSLSNLNNMVYGNLAAKHKTQRNTFQRVEILEPYTVNGADPATQNVYYTASVRDNGFVTRPIPTADRSQWFMFLSGTNSEATELFSQYILSSSRYPDNISGITASLNDAIESQNLAAVTSSGGTISYTWGSPFAFVPWSQTRAGQTTAGQYFVRNNVYETLPVKYDPPGFKNFQNLPGKPMNFEREGYLKEYSDSGEPFLRTRTRENRRGTLIPYNYVKRFREAPVTSRYKPLSHQLRSYLGTAATTQYERKQDLTIDYSYGNFLMGFANRELNEVYRGDFQFMSGKIKRPYEIFRDNYVSDVDSTVDAIERFYLGTYAETIYPKEIYTYLSGTRSRLNFRNSFWRNDIEVTSFNIGTVPITNLGTQNSSELNYTPNEIKFNPQWERIQVPFTTSQGYPLQRSEQCSYDFTDTAATPPSGPGSGSIWSMDSYLYAESSSSLQSAVDGSGAKVLFAGASTLPCGELMLTSFGAVETNTSASPITSSYKSAGTVSAQYIYSVPTVLSSSTSTSAVASTASITALKAPSAGVAADGTVTLDPSWASTMINGTILTLADDTTSCDMTFDNTTSVTTVACPITIGIQAMEASGDDVRDQIILAVNNAAADVGIACTATTNGSGSLKISANAPGTAGNALAITWSETGALSDIGIVAIAGGVEPVVLDGHMITLTSVVPGPTSKTHTMQFKSDGTTTPADEIIDVQAATSVSDVATAIGATITQAQLAGNTDIAVSSVASSTVNLVVDTAGAAGNASTITGDAETVHSDISSTSFGGGADASTSQDEFVAPCSPGGAPSRPAWVAHKERRAVSGPTKGVIIEGRNPSYDSYEKYASDVRLKGQEFTLTPEFRISELVPNYVAIGDPVDAFQAQTLSITGSNQDIYDSSNSNFLTRYSQTDKLEYLKNFIRENSKDLEFNKYPRHLQLQSEGIVKLLPYDGFYPMDRSLQIASSYSSSYSMVFEGTSGSVHAAVRSVLRPMFAPGIFYNAIKSGLAVDYPIRRKLRNENGFPSINHTEPLKGCLGESVSSAIVSGSIPGNNRHFPGNNPATRGQGDFDFTIPDVDKFMWADRLPFEALLSPEDYINNTDPTILSDFNKIMYLDVTGALNTKVDTSPLYKKSISNFLGATPQFFLKEKQNKNNMSGFLTKFVSDFGANSQNSIINPSLDGTATTTRTVYCSNENAYVMEIGLLKTNNFNLYSNPYAFGVPTATGSAFWGSYNSGTVGNLGAEVPSGSAWPKHYGEFAPFTPPYYYGPSLARITFFPAESGEYTLDQIIGPSAENTYIEYVNESGSYFDFSSGSFVDSETLETVSTTGTPPYGWNRAWQNRMDIDASLVITNEFPLENGSARPKDPNKWVIMPKWECPILDFPDRSLGFSNYDFSSSIDPGHLCSPTQGMWHQYGVEPDPDQGVYMFIKDVTPKETELRLVGDPSLGASSATGQQKYVFKLPQWVISSNRTVSSLADLVGFDSEEIMRSGFEPTKAKKLGTLPDNNEKELSEAILALPYYYDSDGIPRLMNLKANEEKLGPKIKEFRKVFTKYSLPPALAISLLDLVPDTYPLVSEYINPFGGDDYDVKTTTSLQRDIKTPVVYLFEHSVRLTKQDLADIWQGVLPTCGKKLEPQVVALDHYMPGDNVEEEPIILPEMLVKELELGLPRNGHPRGDLLDIAELRANGVLKEDAFNAKIKWLVYKVKRRGTKSYDDLILNEINGYGYKSFYRDSGILDRQNLSREQAALVAQQNYMSDHAIEDPTYNWPYDYFSLVELSKLTSKIGFRPDLGMEVQSVNDTIESTEGVDFGNVSTAQDGVPSAANQSETLGGLVGNTTPLLQETQQTIGQLNNASPSVSSPISQGLRGFNGNNYEG